MLKKGEKMCKLFRIFRALKHVTDEFDPRQLEKFKEKVNFNIANKKCLEQYARAFAKERGDVQVPKIRKDRGKARVNVIEFETFISLSDKKITKDTANDVLGLLADQHGRSAAQTAMAKAVSIEVKAWEVKAKNKRDYTKFYMKTRIIYDEKTEESVRSEVQKSDSNV